MTDYVKSVMINCRFVVDVYIPLHEDIDKSSNKASAKSINKCLDVLKSMHVNYQARLIDLVRLASRLAYGHAGRILRAVSQRKVDILRFSSIIWIKLARLLYCLWVGQSGLIYLVFYFLQSR